MPFAAIGFASVVSLMPGAYMFGTYSGLLQTGMGAQGPQLLAATIANGLVAATIILAMSLGLIVPKILMDRLATLRRERRAKNISTSAAHRKQSSFGCGRGSD